MTKEITIKKYELSKPEQMSKMALTLKKHVVGHNLYTNIQGRNYAHVEGWQFAGGLLGLFPRVNKVENLSTDKEVKWLAEVEIVNTQTNEIMSRGYAVCSNSERIKKNFDEYAVLSMAQTRAIGKAYRNLVGWVMKLAGYESTPAEEMPKGEEKATQNAKTEKRIYECHECAEPITEAQKDYSKKLFGRPCCKQCQNMVSSVNATEKPKTKKTTKKKK